MTGRYKKTSIDQRLCTIRNEDRCVEDEFYFLMICKEYQTERIEFCRKINQVIVPFKSFTSQEKIIFLMSTNDTKVLMLLAYFIDNSRGTKVEKILTLAPERYTAGFCMVAKVILWFI